jgi:hypothetical protein
VNDQDAYESGDTLPEEGKRHHLFYKTVHTSAAPVRR